MATPIHSNLIAPATAPEARRVSMAVEALGGMKLVDADHAITQIFPFPGAREATGGDEGHKIFPQAVKPTKVGVKGCGHYARFSLPYVEGDFVFCAVCDGAHLWPKLGAKDEDE